MPNPKMKSFNSYVFVHEARHKKKHIFCTKTDCYCMNNYGEI